MKHWKRQLGLMFLMTVLCFVDSLILWADPPGTRLAAQPVLSQSAERRAIATTVYDGLPDFPRANHYLHSETGDVASGNTLIYRLIQYHNRVQSRPLTSRFDWKLTLADYMGANEWMDEERYPDRFLQSNPFHHDIEIIRGLNRQQREELIQALLQVLGS